MELYWMGLATPEEIKALTGHATNKAFERYFRADGDALKELYARRKSLTNPDNQLTTKNGHLKKIK
jgi:hypothetical protein